MFSFFKNRGIGTKIGMGFALATLVLVGAITTTIVKVQHTAEITNRVVDLRVPTAQASLGMLNGINHSLAALRGWIILGKDKFKDERYIAWSQDIEPALAIMEEFSVNWTDPENIRHLATIKAELANFKTFQQEIEDIAQTIENTPASHILFKQAAPRASVLSTNITKMIDLEAQLEATPERKALLGMMADVRGTLGLGLGAIRAYLLSGDEGFKDQFDQLWAKNTRRFGDLSSQVELLTPEQKEAFDAFSKAREEFSPLPPLMFEIRSGEEWNLANRWLGTKAAPAAFAIKTSLDAMIESQQKLMANDMDQGTASTAALMKAQWVLLAFGSFACLILGVFITRTITRPLNATVAMLKDIAEGEGDLTKRLDVSSTDEIGELAKWFNAFVERVHGVISEVSSTSNEVASAATEVAASAEQMEAGLINQQEQTTQVSAAIEEMAATVVEVSAKSSEAASAAEQSGNEALQGGQVVAETVDEMGGISEQVNIAATAVSELGKKGEQIGEIISVINDIADQTNLLALNAAIEAARAGEHGRGFAVVADEVRKLAERTTTATEEVGKSIREIQHETGTAVTQIQAGTERVSKGVELANSAGDALSTIVDSSKNVQSMVQSIAAASEEQSAATSQIARSIEQIDAVTRESLEGARQAAQAAGQLSSQAEGLQAIVAQFKI